MSKQELSKLSKEELDSIFAKEARKTKGKGNKITSDIISILLERASNENS